MKRWLRILFAMGFAFAASACEPGSIEPAAGARCVEAGAQCALPDGPLGVCERSACGPGATPPCFTCVPQH